MKSILPWLRSLAPDRSTLRQDAVAGIPCAIASVPDGKASAVLVGVNPVYGLYASMAGLVGGGLAVSTRLMVVTTTTAAALAAGSAQTDFSKTARPDALFVLSALAGVSALVLMVLLTRTRIASLVALGIPTLVTLGSGHLIRVDARFPAGSPRRISRSSRCSPRLT